MCLLRCLLMRSARVRSPCVALLTALTNGLPSVSHAVDCSDKFPVGSFALTRNDVAPLVAQLSIAVESPEEGVFLRVEVPGIEVPATVSLDPVGLAVRTAGWINPLPCSIDNDA